MSETTWKEVDVFVARLLDQRDDIDRRIREIRPSYDAEDAKFERLRKEAESRLDEISRVQRFADEQKGEREAEIERLKAFLEQAIKESERAVIHITELELVSNRRRIEIEIQGELIVEKDAEIERLNGEVLDLTDRLDWQVNENESKRKLIGELADALLARDFMMRTTEDDILIQRAREVIPND